MDCTCTTDDHDLMCIDGMDPVPPEEALLDAYADGPL